LKNIEAYPLYWPEGQPRSSNRVTSQFKTGFGKARQFLMWEIGRMGGRQIILSTNVPLNKTDGLPRANFTPSDPAVAVYFKRKGKDMAFACDKYHTVTENMQAIAKTIEALRGIERWGTSDMMERAYRGFTDLPEKATQAWRYDLGFGEEQTVTPDDVQSAFRQLSHKYHPDKGGDPEKWHGLCLARENALRDLAA
jgi:hypothetical protein